MDVRPLSWELDGPGWPNRASSRFVSIDGMTWHVHVMGSGPALVLIHGTGASAHSFRALAPLLAEHFTVIAPDLPGHAFTRNARREHFTLPGMAEALRRLVDRLKFEPRILVGHSAGAALALRWALDGKTAPRFIIGINGALFPFRGGAALIFPAVARLLARYPVSARVFSRQARRRPMVERLIEGTGSTLDDAGVRLYQRLLCSPPHIAGALSMMARWDLASLARDLPRVSSETLLVVGAEDGAVPPSDADRARALLRHVQIMTLRNLGHLAHEEDPERLADLITGAWEALTETGANPSFNR